MDREYISLGSENMKQEEYQILRLLGQRVRYYRRLRNLTQEELGEQANVGYKYIGEIERGRKRVSIIVICRLSQALHIPLSDLVSVTGDPSNSYQRCMCSIIRFLEKKDITQLKKAFNLLKICLR